MQLSLFLKWGLVLYLSSSYGAGRVKTVHQPGEEARDFFAMAEESRFQKKYDQAAEQYKQALKISPNFEEALIGLGLVYEQLGDSPRAIKVYESAIIVKPLFIQPRINLAHLYQNLEKDDLAFREYHEILKIDTENEESHYQLGVLNTKKKRYPTALDFFYKTLEINNNHAEAYYNIGVIYSWSGKDKEADTTFRKALKYGLSDLPSLFFLARYYSRFQIPEFSIYCLERVLGEQYKKVEEIERDEHFQFLKTDSTYASLLNRFRKKDAEILPEENTLLDEDLRAP